MHAIEVAETGGPEVLQLRRAAEPSPGPGEVLIKADAIGVNYIDTYFRSGLYPRELPFVLGTEVCGTVAAVGDDVAALGGRPGRDRASRRRLRRILHGAADFSLCPTRAADVAAAPAQGHDRALPDQVRLPGAGWRHRARARRGGRCRTHPDPVGHQPGGAGDHHRLDAGEGGISRQAGAMEVLDYPEEPGDFAATIRELTNGGVAAVYDGVGAATFDASLASLAVRGTLALFGASSGPVPAFDPQRLNAAGSVYLTRPTSRTSPAPRMNSLGGQANYLMRSPRERST